jgi:methylated-DNA-[protein]-cysteine S-methyltransferase
MPFAVLGLCTNGSALTSLHYLPLAEHAAAPVDGIAEHAMRELERWLDDPAFRFTVALAPAGTAFRKRVWAALAAIPCGQSRTYGDVARIVRSAPRAVGQACGDNPIPLVIPCHRVVAANGSLGGFMHATDGDPIAIKRWLLAHEGAGLPP